MNQRSKPLNEEKVRRWLDNELGFAVLQHREFDKGYHHGLRKVRDKMMQGEFDADE